jgi:exopolysaccharide biosynthesis polyprenyl glycosylphosphotransferase
MTELGLRATDPAESDGAIETTVRATDAAIRAQVSPRSASTAWKTEYQIGLLTFDFCAMVLATVIGYDIRFRTETNWHGYALVGLVIVFGWLIALQSAGGYDVRHLGSGPEEAKRVLRASVVTIGAIAIVCYAAKFPLARGYVIGVLPVGTVLLLAERSLVRRYVERRRAVNDWSHRIVAVGTAESVRELIAVTSRSTGAGLRVIGVCVEDADPGTDIVPGVPVLGSVLDTARHAADVDADVVAVTGSGLGPVGVRELGWQLEGTGRGLVMAPALTEIAGTRMHMSPVEGLPLVWLDQPQFGRVPRIIKRTADLVGALSLIIVGSPVFLAVAVAIKVTSGGPVFFRQSRLGINGREFKIFKFRSMYQGAEARRAELLKLNEQDGGGVLFKMRHDPRITPIGRILRKFSIDELPQLVDVLRGHMSLVGPRPLATDDSNYDGPARRRLLVRPGVTGLWQVSGRSELSWDDAVRLDLYYVENWSLAMDLSILARTVVAVVARKGAY